ncbi:MAG TPA: hypothetical protein VIP70_06840 [Nitrososphaeraceae archaeon]
MSDKEKEEKEITEQLGPITEFHMKMRLPQAFVDYIEEVAIKQNREAASLEEYCNQEFLAGLIAYLDNEEERVLKNYTIPKYCFEIRCNIGYLSLKIRQTLDFLP